ncbi:GTPase SLIP-GC, partial [Chaetura pelagica]
ENPENGEGEALEGYRRQQNDLNATLDQAVEKLSVFLSNHNLPETRKGIEYLKNRLTGLKSDILVNPIYVGLFGTTGAGKSTLLNAIIDKRFFLPVSGSKSCTSCVVQVSMSHSKQYEAKIHLLTDEEWKDELKCLVALAEDDEDEDSNEQNEAVSKISAIYGEGSETKSYEELCRMRPVIPIPSARCITLREANEEDLSKKMGPYIWIQSIRNGEAAGTSEENKKPRLWPLIKNVEVTIPRLQVFPEGVIFVDIPGTGDFNSKRDAMWKENINKCSVIWVVNSIERIQGDKHHEKMLKEGMKAFQCGVCKDISLVVTKSDQMDLSEYQRESGNNHINKHDAILERNETVKREKTTSMRRNLGRKFPSSSEVLDKDDLVYTVSARKYWSGDTLNRDETEIPKLREYIRSFYKKQKRNELMDYVTEALAAFSLIQSLPSNQDPESQQVKESHLKELIMNKITDLDKDIEKCFVPIEQPLQDGIDQAKRSYKKNMNRIFNVHGGQGFHRTLKAVCMKNGVYTSRSFGRIDINEDLAEPIYDKIDITFGNIFRIQMGTRATLKSCLDLFKDAMKEALQEAMNTDNFLQLNRGVKHLKFFLQIDFIMREIEKVILQRKGKIYESVAGSIKEDLLPYYKDAASQRGAQAYARMQTILSEGVKTELEKGMFEKVQASMRSHFESLK